MSQWRAACGRVLATTVALLVAACQRGEPPVVVAEGPPPVVLRRGLGAEPGTLDPQLAEDNASLTIAAELYEGLTAVRPDGAVEPGAAERWETAPDGRSFVLHLRRNLRWSNGDALTAAHFATGLRGLTAPDSLAPGAGLFAALERVTVVDAYTLRLELRRPSPQLPTLLALPAASPRHPQQADKDLPVGNGPFRVVRRVPGELIELERNPYYRGAAQVALDGVLYRTVADLGTEMNLYRTGDLDITSEVPNSQFARLRADSPAELHVAPYLSVYAYAVNLARLPDRDARRALAMAVDRPRITTQVTGAGERPALGWVPDGLPGYVPARFEWRDLPYDAAATEARTAWQAARARGAAPSRLKLCTDASANHHRTAVALADLWHTALGIETSIVELEWGVYLEARRRPGDCDLMRLGWSADFLDPEAFASVFESGGPQNTLGYRSARYDALLAQSRAVSDPAQRMALIAGAEAQLLADVAVIPIFFRVSKRLVKPYVTGVGTSPLGLLPSRDLGLKAH